MARISVVIPTYQRREAVLRALRALARQTVEPEDYEVVLSVDGSTDGTREAAESLNLPYRLRVRWHENRGRAAACNAGARAAEGDLLVFLDDDMEPGPRFLEGHQRAHPPGTRRAVVGPAPIPVDASSPPTTLYRSSGFTDKLGRLEQPGYRPRMRDVYCGNFSIARALFWEVGGYDEEFQAYGHEDFELLHRLQSLDVEWWFEPAAFAVQHYEKQLAGIAADKIEEGRTAVLLALKHPGMADQLELSTWARRSWRHRAALTGLVCLSRAWKQVPGLAVALFALLERQRPSGLHRYYNIVFDYLFWLGVDQALRAEGVREAWRISPAPSLAALRKAGLDRTGECPICRSCADRFTQCPRPPVRRIGS